MIISIDDTDSPDRMCTTYLAVKLIEESGLDLIGFPRLVRLNPNIRFKTRGNGAIVLNLGKGTGRSSVIGDIGGKPLRSFETMYKDADEDDLLEIAKNLIEEYAVMDYYSTHPGIVIANQHFDESFYWRALEEEIPVRDAEDFIIQNGGVYHKMKEGHGIVGAAAAISWPAPRRTFEILEYTYPHPQEIDRNEKMRMSMIADGFPGTFNNVDLKNNYPAIFPHPRTPVIYGIRSVNPDVLLNASDAVNSSGNITYESRIIYETNQATDDHILIDPLSVEDLHSYRLTGYVETDPISVPGGHYFCRLRYRDYSISIAAFEPTKEFRSVFSKLRAGDRVTVFGSFVNGNLNVEKMIVHSVAKIFRLENPVCRVCNAKTVSKGHGDFRCPVCGRRYRIPAATEVRRDLTPGMYDVPVIARRHLSMPFEIRRKITGSVVEENKRYADP